MPGSGDGCPGGQEVESSFVATLPSQPADARETGIPADGPTAAADDRGFAFYQSPQRFLIERARAEGPVARFRINAEPFAVLSDPNGIHAVLNGSLEDFERGSFADIPRRILGESVFTLDGREWTGHHAILAPLFSRQRVRSLTPLIEGLVNRQMEAWDRRSAGGGADLRSLSKRFAFDVVATGLLGIADATIADELFEALERLDRIEWVRLSYLAQCTTKLGEHFEPSPLYGRIDELMYVIADQRVTMATPADDLLGASMASPRFAELPAEKKRTFIRDLMASMLSAGYATTGESIFWTLYLLARHPAAQARVRSDLRAVHAAARPWCEAPPSLTAAFNESLRLYPPAWFIGRIPRKPLRLGSEEIAAGTRLITSPWVLHRMPALWPEPEEFRPERFLPDAVVAPRNFIPFGAGMRACLGQSLAQAEMSAFLSATLSRFDVRLASEEPVSLAATFTLQPRQRILFEVRRCR